MAAESNALSPGQTSSLAQDAILGHWHIQAVLIKKITAQTVRNSAYKGNICKGARLTEPLIVSNLTLK